RRGRAARARRIPDRSTPLLRLAPDRSTPARDDRADSLGRVRRLAREEPPDPYPPRHVQRAPGRAVVLRRLRGLSLRSEDRDSREGASRRLLPLRRPQPALRVAPRARVARR